jgi:GT2 family glycosyltransferase
MQLSIIIVNYNVKYFLEHCLLSVAKACKGIEAEIFVVDNNSTDGSQAYLEPTFPEVNFIWNEENVGFGKANNSVLNRTKGQHILFLNPDTIVPADCFTNCLSFFDTHSDCGAIGVRMIDGSGIFLKESKRCLPTPTAGFFKMLGLDKAFPNSTIFARYYAGHLPEKQNNKVEVLAGAFMMLSKKAIDNTKGFDEDFFMYGEDIDLSYRIIKAGLYNYYLGENTIVHFKGESTQKKSALYITHFYRAMKLFVDKHYSGNKVKQVLMSFVIAAGKQARKIKNKLLKENNKSNVNLASILIVGKAYQIDAALKIVAIANATTVKIDMDDTQISYDKILHIANDKKVQTILLCEGKGGYSYIIKAMQTIAPHFLILFYADGAGSVIGSNDKNSKGIFFTAN